MKHLKLTALTLLTFVVLTVGALAITTQSSAALSLPQTFAATKSNSPCSGGSFLSFPAWYEYLGSITSDDGQCTPVINGISDIWLIVAAGIEILLQVAALIAVFLIMYAGFQFLTSQGDPAKAAQARQGIINSVVGLVIAVMAAVMVGFIAGSIR